MNIKSLPEPFLDKEFALPSEATPHWYRWLLVGSLCINAAAMTFFFTEWNAGVLWFEVEAGPRPEISTKAVRPSSDSLQIELTRMFALSDQDLLALLKERRIVANGYEVRELVLSVLEMRGYQIQDPLRSTGLWPISKSSFSWKEPFGAQQTTSLYSSLQEEHFNAIEKFYASTKVPFTSEAIVARLRDNPSDTTLIEALVRTDDWSILSRLFSDRSQAELLSLLTHIGSSSFTRLVDYAKAGGTAEGILPILMNIFHESPSGPLADCIATQFANYIVFQATDEDVLLLLQKLPPTSTAGIRLAMRLLRVQRKGQVWTASQAYLATEKELQPIATMNRDQALAFLQKLAHPLTASEETETSVPKCIPEEPKKFVERSVSRPSASAIVSNRLAVRQLQPYKKYVVKKGDTLWAIAKRFNVDVEKLKYLNGLRGTDLSIGKELRIPH